MVAVIQGGDEIQLYLTHILISSVTLVASKIPQIAKPKVSSKARLDTLAVISQDLSPSAALAL
jgi:hypothetical protein